MSRGCLGDVGEGSGCSGGCFGDVRSQFNPHEEKNVPRLNLVPPTFSGLYLVTGPGNGLFRGRGE